MTKTACAFGGRRPVRVYMDGCFDLMHYGHANALRQARVLGDELVVGLIPDSEIERCKGPPILNEKERLELVRAVKWVDDVIVGVPYDLTPDFLSELFHRHRIDYVIHGDDPCLLPDGTDAYAHAKRLGRFRAIKRTEGVSTTDIVGRMLICSRAAARGGAECESLDLARHFSLGGRTRSFSVADEGGAAGRLGQLAEGEEEDALDALLHEEAREAASPASLPPRPEIATSPLPPVSRPSEDGLGEEASSPSSSTVSSPRLVSVSRFMPTSHRIVQFSSGRVARPGSCIVYLDGAFDLFHVGHVAALRAARAAGDFLLVGLHDDEDVAARRGPHQPIMSVHERALSVLACKYADEVIIGAPRVITADLLTTFNISKVVRGTVHETGQVQAAGADRGSLSSVLDDDEAERYAEAQARGVFERLRSSSRMTSAAVIARIVANRAQFEARNAKKMKSEAEYYAGAKTFVSEL
ncbi:hypothetical protein H632_c175p1 [Helicosporidium sp. ATCC 50920]|nr:hypothetical protein H632_c175p1 [Helicosporidium sp. ATCC 50920]|eukprot:KDD76579.1 hypothetical protein H632_c175p1 [Helicosporidium sp. ATCC 50920]